MIGFWKSMVELGNFGKTRMFLIIRASRKTYWKTMTNSLFAMEEFGRLQKILEILGWHILTYSGTPIMYRPNRNRKVDHHIAAQRNTPNFLTVQPETLCPVSHVSASKRTDIRISLTSMKLNAEEKAFYNGSEKKLSVKNKQKVKDNEKCSEMGKATKVRSTRGKKRERDNIEESPDTEKSKKRQKRGQKKERDWE